MNGTDFVDYYDNLQVSQNASADTIEHVYRLLVRRYHPDNQSTGNAEKFREVRQAFELLSDPEKRTAYDVTYDENRKKIWSIFDQDSATDAREEDRRIFHGILSLLYVSRRRDADNPGIGPVHLEMILGCPQQHIEFHIWYLKQRGWVETLSSGQLAITADGVDKLGDQDLALRKDRLISQYSGGENESPDSKRERQLSEKIPLELDGVA
jgi:curved DNA-binding protein CbpA